MGNMSLTSVSVLSGAVLENRNNPVCMSLMLGLGSNENDPDPSHHEYPSCDSIGTRFMVDEATHPSEILVGRDQIEMTQERPSMNLNF